MDAQKILLDAASRPLAAILPLAERITPEIANAHPGGHDNSIAWLLWHTGREIDAQVAALSGAQEIWSARGYREETGIEEPAIGYGHSPGEARAVEVSDPQVLVAYLSEVTFALEEYISRLTEADLAQVVDPDWDPPVTRGVRLVSIIDDAAQHAGQVGYALGILEG